MGFLGVFFGGIVTFFLVLVGWGVSGAPLSNNEILVAAISAATFSIVFCLAQIAENIKEKK
jgi:hypothetical protein